MNTVYITWPFMAFNVLVMFVLGFYADKQQIFAQIPDQLIQLLL